MNWSGTITSADQIKIGRFIVGIDTQPTAGIWKFYSTDHTPTDTSDDPNFYRTIETTRFFENIQANTSAQNFIGIKIGDVNNSWVGR